MSDLIDHDEWRDNSIMKVLDVGHNSYNTSSTNQCWVYVYLIIAINM